MNPIISLPRCELTGKSIETSIIEARTSHKLPYLLATKKTPEGLTCYFDGISLLEKAELERKAAKPINTSIYSWFQEKKHCLKADVTDLDHIYTGSLDNATSQLLKRFYPHDGFKARIEYIKKLSKDIFSPDVGKDITEGVEDKTAEQLYFWYDICLNEYSEICKNPRLAHHRSAVIDLIDITMRLGGYHSCIMLILQVLESSYETETIIPKLYDILRRNKLVVDETTKNRINQVFLQYALNEKRSSSSQELYLKILVQITYDSFRNPGALDTEKATARSNLESLSKTFPDSKMLNIALLKMAIRENRYTDVKRLSCELFTCENPEYAHFAKQAYAGMIVFSGIDDETELNNTIIIIAASYAEKPNDVKSLELLSMLMNRYAVKFSTLPKHADSYLKRMGLALESGHKTPELVTATARIYAMQNRLDSAIDLLNKYAEVFPFSIDILQLLAETYQKNALEKKDLKSRDLSIEHFKKVIEIDRGFVLANIGAAMQMLQNSYVAEDDAHYIAGCIDRLNGKFLELESCQQGLVYCLSALLYTKLEYFNLRLAIENIQKAISIPSTNREFLRFALQSIKMTQDKVADCSKYLLD